MAAAKDTVSGLEQLTRLATINIHQKDARFKGNKYIVQSEGETLFTLKEDSHAFTFMTRARIRGFNMEGVDNTGSKVFTLHRPGTKDMVELHMNNVLTSLVRKDDSASVFSINDANDCPTLRIIGDGSRYDFQTKTNANIGSINKKFRGMAKEMFSYSDDYDISFPVDLDVRFKLAVIATCILIDYTYHEKR